MLNVLTVFKSGGDYTRDYVIGLRRGIAQHMKPEHRFICLTDAVKETVFDDDWNIQWEPLRHDWPGWWSKVEMFRPDLERYGRILFLDLSCLVVGDLDDIALYDGPACITSDWYHGGPSQSVLSFAPGEMRAVWDLFKSDPDKWMERGDKRIAPDFGDQVLVNEVYGLDGLKRWQTELPGQVVSFKVHCGTGVPKGARLVKFHGEPRIHDCQEPWVREAWTRGFNLVRYTSGCNTGIATILGQVKHNSEAKGVKWLRRPVRAKKHVCIVGGAPSLADDLDGIKLRKRLGHTIWALNGAHDYLIERGIVPDALLIMDARPHNIKFLEHLHKRVEYMLCSRCHPSLFDAVKGYKVTLWHSYDEGVAEYLEVEHSDKPWAAFTGGGTVGLRAMTMAEGVGYKFIHLYGMDSSYEDDAGHAYAQPQNDDERVVDVFVGDRKFRAAPWMVRQVENFQEQYPMLAEKGVRVSVHGRGMLPYVAGLMGTTGENSFI